MNSGNLKPSRLRIWVGATLLVLYTAFIFVVTLTPSQMDINLQLAIQKLIDLLHRHGLPLWFDYAELEFSANIAMFVPFGFIVTILLPQRVWWLSFVFGPVLSIYIEAFQFFFLPERVSSFLDIVANSSGAIFGTLIAALLRRIIRNRDERVIAIALAKANDENAYS